MREESQAEVFTGEGGVFEQVWLHGREKRGTILDKRTEMNPNISSEGFPSPSPSPIALAFTQRP